MKESCVMWAILSALLVLSKTTHPSHAAAEEGLLLYYPCDDKTGTVLKDAGPAGAHGDLNAQINGEVRGASVTCSKTGEWIPILTQDGIQRKGIVAGSDSALAEGERPIVLDRDKDYAIDIVSGRIKALGGGRVELGQPFTFDFRFSNPGPAWAEGKAGGCLKLDGVDDFVTLGRESSGHATPALTLQLWIFLSREGSSESVLLEKTGWSGKEDACALRLRKNALEWFHPFLKTADGKPAPPTAGKEALVRKTWLHLAAIYDGSTAVLMVNGREIARQPELTGKLDANGPWRVGGVRDPEFFGGMADEIKIYAIARSPEEIAWDAR